MKKTGGQGGDNKKAVSAELSKKRAAAGRKKNPNKGTPAYMNFKEPKDIMKYINKLLISLHKDKADQANIGKVSQLVNNWLSAYKTQMETNEYKKLKDEFDKWKAEMELDEQTRT